MNMTLYFNDYGPAYTDTIGWILVATNSMTYRLITSSFDTWTQSPITTTIETLPISQVVLCNCLPTKESIS